VNGTSLAADFINPDEAGQAGPGKDTSCVWDKLNVVWLSAGPTGARSNQHALSDMT